jgi:hypothetical protein
VEIVGTEPTFVDIYDEIDIYNDKTWRAAESYFWSLGKSHEDTLPGGRYATALALKQRCLPFLAGFTLGRICHFTQIATSKRKLLGYANGRIVPFASSSSLVKAQCAERQLPHVASSIDVPPLPVADWNIARATLQDIIATATMQGSLPVPLSNIKRIFRSTHRLELSETALGHSRLTDLLRDEKFHDICTIALQDRGYVVMPARESSVAAHPILGDLTSKRQPLDVASGSIPCETLERATLGQHEVVPAVDSLQRFCPDEPLCLEDMDMSPMEEVSPTAAPFPFPTPSPQYTYGDTMRGDKCNQDLVCHLLGMATSAHETHNCKANTVWTRSDFSKAAETTEEALPISRQAFCPDEPLDLEAVHQETSKEWMSPAPCAAWTPSPHYSTRCFLSYRLGCTDQKAGSGTAQSQSRSTSAESRYPVVLSESGSSSIRSDSSSDGDHEVCPRAAATGYHIWPPQQLACSSESQFSSIAVNHEPHEPACQDGRHLAWQVCQPASSNNQQPRMIPPLAPTLPDSLSQRFSMSQTLPEGFDASRAASAHEPADLTATYLADAVSLRTEAHLAGTCQPCAHFHSRKGCSSAELCLFCHSCPPGELKRRQKAKRRLMKFCELKEA